MLLDPPTRRLERLPVVPRLRFAHAPAAHHPLLGPMTVTRLTLPPIAVLTGPPGMNASCFVRSADGAAVTRRRVPVVAADSRGHHSFCPTYATALGW